MKVPLRVRRKFDEWMPFVSISLRAPRVRPTPIEALVDTGSPWIALAPKDVRRLNISISRLRKATKYSRVTLAGYKFWRYLLTKVSAHMRTEKEGIISIDLPSISVLWPTKKKPPKGVKDIPSVLGSDFLTVGKFYLLFDPSRQIAFLERQTQK